MVAANIECESIYVAARFGWYLAMLRGRLRDGSPPEAGAGVHRTAFALPLGVERSWEEQTIRTEAVVRGLAQLPGLAVDLPLAELSYQEKDAEGLATDRLRALTKELALN